MKNTFSASQDLLSTRRKALKLPETGSQRAVFSIKPTDFSMKLYSHLTISQKNKKTLSDASQLMFVRMGKFPSDPKRNPKPQNFTPMSFKKYNVFSNVFPIPSGIKTAFQRDPGNLNFKLKHLDSLRTSRSELNPSFRHMKTQPDTYKPAEPKWGPKLCLPPLPWPPKSASFTRHRRRGAYSTFLDRVEKKVGEFWKNEH
ncbi:uncharacterized protein si:dkey-30e9.6 [Girardinichthys multiradiatus]|uniref:uncharacterized protein si:dkey-30e9.6 n=1 Tax=Girardinichthys multiradiatus TaxID=208333 RepID=UPI001FADD3C7|nr:uncharacterized protein si:dkey-30e9.6 [Girardinichthys multiradiatus]